MVVLHPEFVPGKDNQSKAVLLPFSEWESILDELEELDDIREFDAVKSSTEESIPFYQAVREIRNNYDV